MQAGKSKKLTARGTMDSLARASICAWAGWACGCGVPSEEALPLELGHSGRQLRLPSVRVYEAEQAERHQAVVEDEHRGFSGSGYVNTENVAGSYLQWTVDSASDCPATLTWRAANGSGLPRTVDVVVNGTLVTAGFTWVATGSWTDWQRAGQTAVLAAGRNSIRLVSAGPAGGPNYDYLEVSSTCALEEPTAIYEAEDGSFRRAVVESEHAGFSGRGYVNTHNVAGSYVELEVEASRTGPAELTFRYANGHAPREVDLWVNGVRLAKRYAFASTGSWTTYLSTAPITAPFHEGSNAIRLVSRSSDGGPNYDRLEVRELELESESASPVRVLAGTTSVAPDGVALFDVEGLAPDRLVEIQVGDHVIDAADASNVQWVLPLEPPPEPEVRVVVAPAASDADLERARGALERSPGAGGAAASPPGPDVELAGVDDRSASVPPASVLPAAVPLAAVIAPVDRGYAALPESPGPGWQLAVRMPSGIAAGSTPVVLRSLDGASPAWPISILDLDDSAGYPYSPEGIVWPWPNALDPVFPIGSSGFNHFPQPDDPRERSPWLYNVHLLTDGVRCVSRSAARGELEGEEIGPSGSHPITGDYHVDEAHNRVRLVVDRTSSGGEVEVYRGGWIDWSSRVPNDFPPVEQLGQRPPPTVGESLWALRSETTGRQLLINHRLFDTPPSCL